jgi:hypothetical protein
MRSQGRWVETLLLDVLILLATVEHIVVRVVKSFNRQQLAATPTESPE